MEEKEDELTFVVVCQAYRMNKSSAAVARRAAEEIALQTGKAHFCLLQR